MRKWKIIRTLMLLLCFMYLCLWDTKELYAEENKPKCIYVVFDNSESMVSHENTDLADATYALQVIISMLDEQDKLVIYPVSCMDGAEIKIQGDSDIGETYKPKDTFQPLTVSDLHDKGIKSSVLKLLEEDLAKYTYFASVRVAEQDLLQENQNKYEKWLVILTDGEYEDWVDENDTTLEGEEVTGKVVQRLDHIAANGINVIHYAFHNDSYHETNSEGVFYFSESKEDTMLSIMVQIGNLIFSRRNVAIKGGQIALEVPAKQLWIFAQNSEKIRIEFQQEMKQVVRTVTTIPGNSFKNKVLKNQYTVGNTYNSQVHIYYPAIEDELLREGSYNINSEAEKVEAYFVPDLGIRLVLKNESGEEFQLNSNNRTIPYGNYTFKIELYNPITKEALAQKLEILKDAQFQLLITKDTGEVILSENTASGSIEIQKGKYTINGIADIYDGLQLTDQMELDVVDPLENIEAEIIVPEEGINFENTESENAVFLTMTQDGKPLSEEFKKEVSITFQDMEDSYYKYKIVEVEDGWKLIPKENPENADNKPYGIKDLNLLINLTINNMGMLPINIKQQVNFHGNEYTVKFSYDASDNIGFWRSLYYYFHGLDVNLLLNDSRVDWKVIDNQNLEYNYEGKEIKCSTVESPEPGYRIKLTANPFDTILSGKPLEYTEKIELTANLERYGVTCSGNQVIGVHVKISVYSIILVIFFILIFVYVLLCIVLKKITGCTTLGLEATLHSSFGPRQYNDKLKIKRKIIYNCFHIGSSKANIKLNEVMSSHPDYIAIKCRSGNSCFIENEDELLAYPNILINMQSVQKNSYYNLKQGITISFKEQDVYLKKR